MLRLIRFKSNAAADSSQLASRFTQILEEKLKNDPTLAGKLNDPEKAAFDHQFSHHLNYLKLETLLKYNKHSKDIALDKPWTGSESKEDASLRMILDLKPRPKPTAGLDAGIRILNAREISSEYKETKLIAPKDDNFRELYKERLLGPAMLINPNSPTTTLNMANTMASAKINATIDLKTGKFNDENMNKVRGKPLNREHLANSTDTSYFINQILNKQDVLPPWIENQQNLNLDIINFRKSLDGNLVNYCRLNGIPEKTKLLAIFTAKQLNYCLEKTKLINKAVRDYNLQSPSSSFHKFKLTAEEELKNCVERNYDSLPELIKAYGDTLLYSNTKQGFLSLFDEQKVVSQRPVEKLDVWSSFKQMFKEI